ncbi:MAG: hypothetical protein M3441_12730 [Chloroflexota bacterium]|nr:hypothetical protein [Chloroflexota bacterium]MDQ5825054.1 hypothetical protein [Chloroflexota bacterium]MDQ5866558.1 hypothetical protein [Chloroflexota bacterium]
MKPVIVYDEPRPVTLGDLCEALADGAVPTRNDGKFYLVSRVEVSRLAEALSAYQRRRETAATEVVTA